jgi:exodeoxyribonuclease V alpha subunit
MNPKVAKLVEEARKRHAERMAQQAVVPQNTSSIPSTEPAALPLSQTTNLAQTTNLDFNPQQLAAIEAGLQQKSFCLIGAAGTGKTTVTQELIARLQRASHVMPLAASTKHLAREATGIAILGYTNKAVNNIRKKLPAHLQAHCMTIHKLLEFAPVYYDIADSEGGMKKTMRFEPSYSAVNKLPHISTIILEESSMIGTDLYGQLIAALPKAANTQMIFLGDLNQIPPVFGPSILGFKMAELQTIELTHVYRQALLSPIISLATSVRTGDLANIPSLIAAQTIDGQEHGKIHFQPWKKRCDKDDAMLMMRKFIPSLISAGKYDPENDMILMPFNKSYGTIELNKIIADYLSKQRGAEVFEVIARYQQSYWAVGDRVMHDRHEATIVKIEPTIGYYGKEPVPASKTLDRWGADSESSRPTSAMTADEILNSLDALGSGGDDDDAKNLASHNITVFIPDLGIEKTLCTAGEINSMTFGYALTIHKSQGSEWQNVFLFLHNSHATMLSRELIYTAITRAKHSLFIICEADMKPYENSIKIAAQRPRIPGTTLQEKISFFARKAKEMRNMTEDEA